MLIPNPRYVQYGCGFSAPLGWINFDASPTLRFERLPAIGKLYTKNAQRFPYNVQYGDIVLGLPIEDDSCDLIYCSHVLEHLALEDFHTALRNTHRYLKPGGLFRLVVPDLACLVERYRSSRDPLASVAFITETLLGEEKRPRSLSGLLKTWLANSGHRWMWDEPAMIAKLAEHGFRNMRRAAKGDSSNRRFLDVEDPARFVDALAVECTKVT